MSEYKTLLPALTLAKKEIWRFLRYWNDALIEPIVTTTLYLAVFGMVMDWGQPAGAPSYTEYLAAGLIVMAIAINSFDNPAYSILLAKYEGSVVDLLLPPFNGVEIAFGYVAGAIVRGMAVTAVVLAIECLFVPFPPIRIMEFLVVALLISAFFGVVGILVSVASESWDQMLMVVTYILTPLQFLSTAFFKLDRADESIITAFVTYNPVSWMVELLRYTMGGSYSKLAEWGLWFLIGGNVILIMLCYRVFKTGWRLKS